MNQCHECGGSMLLVDTTGATSLHSCNNPSCAMFGEEYESTGLTLEPHTTSRGFFVFEFKDRYGEACSLQESSLATEGAIWFGTDGRCVQGPPWSDCPLPANVQNKSRMHLTQAQVIELLPHLQRFAKTGYLKPQDAS